MSAQRPVSCPPRPWAPFREMPLNDRETQSEVKRETAYVMITISTCLYEGETCLRTTMCYGQKVKHNT